MAQASNGNGISSWSLQGMTALVTGGSRGLGHAVVEELAELGASVHMCTIDEAELNKCIQEWEMKGFKVSGSICDVSSRAGRVKLMDQVSNLFNGKLNILINNVGTNVVKPTVEYSAGIVSVSVGSLYGVTKGAMNQLAKNLACEWARDNIRANSVAPYFVRTSLTEPLFEDDKFYKEEVVVAEIDKYVKIIVVVVVKVTVILNMLVDFLDIFS
ncbi:hypothetical protein QYF36_008524 [Acer negundo]|nr:hypothetical protein QYF36_008524 [Acer negundo]